MDKQVPILNSLKWDRRFLGMAKFVSDWSKDPSTRTGSVIVDNKNRVVSVGYNGFARGVKDTIDRYKIRELKYSLVVHCECNSVLSAQRSVEGCTLYTYPFQSCSRCAAMMIAAGIVRCVAPTMPDNLKERWEEDCKLAKMQFEEAGVKLDLIDFN